MDRFSSRRVGNLRSRRDILKLGIAATSSLLVWPTAQGKTGWPSQPIRIICALAPGGAVDSVARALGEFMAIKLEVSVVNQNKPGGLGTIAAAEVVRSEADGHTLLFLLHSQLAQAPVLLKNLSFDPDEDLIPIGAYGTGSSPLVVRHDLPVNNLTELIDYAKQKDVFVGNYAVGSSWQLIVDELAKETGARFNLINYKGTSPMMADLMAGTIDVAGGSLLGVTPGIQSGKAKAIHLISGPKSNKGFAGNTILTGLSSFEDLGFTADAFTRTGDAHMLLAPRGTPQAVIDALTSIVDESFIESERIKAVMARLGQTEKPWTGEPEFDSLLTPLPSKT